MCTLLFNYANLNLTNNFFFPKISQFQEIYIYWLCSTLELIQHLMLLKIVLIGDCLQKNAKQNPKKISINAAKFLNLYTFKFFFI